MSNAKKPAKATEDTYAALQSLIAKGKKDGYYIELYLPARTAVVLREEKLPRSRKPNAEEAAE